MKKSIIILIGAVYILSIIIIGFFGMKLTSYNETIYPERIEIEGVEGASIEDASLNIPGEGVCKYVITYEFKDNATEQENVFSLIYRVYPDTTTNRAVSFSYDKNNSPISKIDERNNFWITGRGGAIIKISAVSRPTIEVLLYLEVI